MGQTYKINDVDYNCEFKFKNSDGQEMEFTKSALRGLTIVDDFLNPFMDGSVSVANPYDLFEDKYLLRGDGRDEFSLIIYPESRPKEKLEYEFILTDELNFGNPEVRSENIKKFSFIHKDALPFMDKIPYGKSYGGKIGDILKELFKELLGDESVDEENWESGDFTISYTPPSTHRYIDLLFYLLKHYYAKDGELHVKGFITKDEGKYTLQLLSKIFEKNGDNLLEAFLLGDFADNGETNNPNNPPKDAEVSEYNAGVKNIGLSTPMYAWNNDHFINTIVHGYDIQTGFHQMRISKLEDLVEKWKTKFVDPFKAISGKPKPFLVRNNSTKEKFRQYRSAFSISDSMKMVEAETYNILTFYNLRSVFANVGSSNRRGGKFIDIVKVGKDETKNDEKMLGRWFVTQLRHNFLGDGYTNEFVCCKTYVGPQSNIKNDAE